MKKTRLLKSVLIMAIIFALMLIGTVSVFAEGETTGVLSRKSYTLTTGSALHLKMSDQDGNEIPDSSIAWTSSDEAVATVDAGGRVVGAKAGKANITAVFNGESYVCKLTVKDPTISRTSYTLTSGSTLHLMLKYANDSTIADSKITWTSSDEAVAAIGADGRVTGLQAGTAEIKGVYNGKAYTCKLTVKDPTISRTSYTLTTGGSLHLMLKYANGSTIPDSKITWTSSDPQVATISTGGSAKSVKSGITIITGTYNGKDYTCELIVMDPTISRTSYTLTRGNTLHLTLKYANGKTIPDSSITWKSSNTDVAAVTTGGSVKAGKRGTATVTGTYKGISLTCKVTVKSPSFNKSSITIMPKDTFHIQLKNASNKVLADSDITWKSSNTKVATVTTGGYIKGIATGTATISAKYKGITYKATVKVVKSDYTLNYSSITLNKLAGEAITVTYTGNGSIGYDFISGDKNVVAYWEGKWDGNKTKLWLVPAAKTGTAKIKIYSEGTDGYRQVSITVKADDINEDNAATLITVESLSHLSNAYWPTDFDLKSAYYYTGVKNCSQSVGIINFSYSYDSVRPGSNTVTYCIHMTDGHAVSKTSGTRHKISSSTMRDIEDVVNSYLDQGE